MGWTREVISQAGSCPRLTRLFPFGPAYVETHDAACRRYTGAPKGWTLTCRGLGIEVRLEAKNEETAGDEATQLLADHLEGLVKGLRGA